MSADGAGSDGGMKQRFELYIKASAIDKETKGSCPICQHWFMITCVLGENQDDIDFKVYTVQADCPPKNFGVDQGWSKKFPVVMVLEGRDKRGQDLAGTKYDTFEELETFFENINKDSKELKRKNAPNVAAMGAVENAYNAFNSALSAGKMNKRFMSALKGINEFLESDPDCKFLVDDVLSFADCYLLPRLQHMRVAGKTYIQDFDDIPEEFSTLWQYLADAYQTEAFRSTMPSDQDIIFHYEKKAGSLSQRPRPRPRPTLQNFTYTLDVPERVAQLLQQRGGHRTNGDVAQEPVEEQQTDPVDISPQHPADEEESPHQQEEEVVGVSQGGVEEQEEPAVSGAGDEGGADVEQSVAQVSLEDEVPSQELRSADNNDEPEEVAYEPLTSDEAAPVNAEESAAVVEEQSQASEDVDVAAGDSDSVIANDSEAKDNDDGGGGDAGEVDTNMSSGGVTITINQGVGVVGKEEGSKVGNGEVVVDQQIITDNVANADGEESGGAATASTTTTAE